MILNIPKKTAGITAGALAAAICLAAVSPARAAALPTENTPKEEVVYVNLKDDGSVDEINVVNIFDLATGEQVIDYGEYSSLRNMTSTAPMEEKDGKITIDAGEGRLYYEGKLINIQIPWKIGIRYELNGSTCTAQELAGQSGKLKIMLTIQQNPNCSGSFFGEYALQATLTLDTTLAKNIVADGATISNVGNQKQLTYTILPGQETELCVTADVTDFEMEEIAINGVCLNLDIQVDDQELMEQVKELQDGIEQLDDGAGKLYNGVTDLEGGGNELKNAAAELWQGVDSLSEGGQTLNSGIVMLQRGLCELETKSPELTGGSSQVKTALTQIRCALDSVSLSGEELQTLVQGSGSIREGIDQLATGILQLQKNLSYTAYKDAMKENGLNIDLLKFGNTLAISQLEGMIGTLQEQIAQLQAAGEDVTQLETQLEQFQQVRTLLMGNNASIEGMEQYLTALGGGVQELWKGINKLQEKYAEFDTAIQTLTKTLSGLMYQMSDLTNGVDQLVTEYEKLDSGICAYTDGVAQIVAGFSQLTKGSSALVEGSAKLKIGTDSLNDGTDALLEGIAQFYDAAGTLRDGASQLRSETSRIDEQVSDQIDALLEEISGGNAETCSFVSEKNTQVKSVQFVMKTEPIRLPETVEVDTQPVVELNFWQKLLKLFGLYHEENRV